MPKNCLFTFLSSILLFSSFFAFAENGTGLEIDNAGQLNVVFTLEPDAVDKSHVKAMFDEYLSAANIEQSQREDAQLFLRVEQQAGEYLLYLDFSRAIKYHANGQCFSKDGFVWGRYVKEISDLDDLYDDIELLIEEFIEAYTAANKL
jgi:preprotein translocase subunit SecF